MGLAVGSLVWVQRKNGSWWPGKVVGLDEAACPLKHLSPSAVKTPIKLLGKENGSVEWHNLETSKRIKAFRSAEFDGFIKDAESVQSSLAIKNGKYAHREDAVLHALQLEKQEQEKSHKTPDNVKQGPLCRAKRSKCVYLPVEKASSENSVLHCQSSKVIPSACVTEDHYQVSSLAEEKDSAESRVSGFSESCFKDNGRRVKQLTGSFQNRSKKRSINLLEEHLSYTSESSPDAKIASGAGSQNLNSNEQPCTHNSGGTPSTVTNGTSFAVSRKRSRNIQDIVLLDTPCKEERNYRVDSKSAEHLALEDKSLFCSLTGGKYLEDSDSLCFRPVHANQHNMMETMLIDVNITVQASYRKEHVPLVSLMSKSNKKAIIGYPIEVEVLEDIPAIFLVRKNSSGQMDGNADSSAHQLVWRTSKRTPVCYITNPHPPARDEKGEQASKTFGDSGLEAKTTNFPPAEEFFLYPPKRSNLSEQNGDNLQITRQNSEKVSLGKQGGSLLREATCIPVEFIFTKLLSAVGT
ncbi:uncharacterized protein LOC113781023 isoform X1 [Coffea eugenioides]|uniref:uncharacterized protein LOC113781013 isoform X1 n=1 Tax=Coffea eugenioides TaxID=49369 RepID=UPI000F604E7C|nr:uncharacterized protein LOC113781013 isoform X1 [Coffea eugenioides]XP_027182650.1 uncharacterized protein LOC113781023 isoform X1 [Coffea eugenioides]